MNMGRFAEMLFKILTASIHQIPTDFTRVFMAETVELVKPKGDRFAIPSQGKFERVVNEVVAWSVVFVVFSGFDVWVKCLVRQLLTFFLWRPVSKPD